MSVEPRFRRIFLYDDVGNPIDDTNPLPTTQQLEVETVIEDTAYDLNAAAYSESATSTYDYIIDSVTFEFSTTQSRTISITSDNGTLLYQGTNTNKSVAVGSINFSQETGQTFYVAITQTVGACTVDVTAQIKNSPVAMTGDPTLAPSDNVIGKVLNYGIVDDNNSSSATLLAGATFTGAATEILDYGIIFVSVSVDSASATNGLSMEQSADGTNWDHTDEYSVNANSNKNYSINPFAKYFRVKYTNSITDQSHFRLQTTLKANSKPSSHRIQDPIVDEDDAELFKSVITGKRTDGIFDNVNLTNGNNLKISLEETEPGANQPFNLDVAKGLVSGHSSVSKFGQNDSLDGTWQDVWDGAGTYGYPPNGTAPVTNVESTSASDVTDLEVQGLDINGTLTVQTVTLTGTTKVVLPTPLWRVFRMKNVGAADYVGIITAENAGNSITYAIIEVGNNQTLMALYTIPLGKTGYMLQGTNSLVGTNRTYTVDGRLTMRPYGGVFQLKRTFGLSADGTSFISMTYPVPGKIPALTDIRVSAKSSATGGVNTTFEIILIDD